MVLIRFLIHSHNSKSKKADHPDSGFFFKKICICLINSILQNVFLIEQDELDRKENGFYEKTFAPFGRLALFTFFKIKTIRKMTTSSATE
jgi:hypothetical protein